MTLPIQCPKPNAEWAMLACALVELRDSLMTLSWSLKDLMAEISSPEKEQAMLEAERFLCRIREVDKRNIR